MICIIEFLIVLGIVVGLFVIIGVCLLGECYIIESIEINCKMMIVYDMVSSLCCFKDWNLLVLCDFVVDLKLFGLVLGVGVIFDFIFKDLGIGFWKIIEVEENKCVVIVIEDVIKGYDKVIIFNLELIGKGGCNVKIIQDYLVKYGFDLFGCYVGLYVSCQIGDDIKMGLLCMVNMFVIVLNVDYCMLEVLLIDLVIVEVLVENLLVVNVGNVDRGQDIIIKFIKDNQEWIKCVMEVNGFEVVGLFCIIIIDFGQEKYVFDIVQLVKKKGVEGVVVDELIVKIDGGVLVKYVYVVLYCLVYVVYIGYMVGLDVVCNGLCVWVVILGNEVIDCLYEIWKDGIDKLFILEGIYDIYWVVK